MWSSSSFFWNALGRQSLRGTREDEEEEEEEEAVELADSGDAVDADDDADDDVVGEDATSSDPAGALCVEFRLV